MQGEIPWMIRVKGAYEIIPFLMYILRERRAFLYDIALNPRVQSSKWLEVSFLYGNETLHGTYEYRINLVGYKEEIK